FEKCESEFEKCLYSNYVDSYSAADKLFLCGYRNLIKKTKPVTINVKDKPLPEVLSMIAHGQPFDYKINQNVVTLTEKKVVENKPDKLLNRAQQRQIVGKVAGAEDEPLQGVSIH